MIHHQLPLPVCLVLLWSGCLLRWTYAAGGPLEWNRVVENGQTLRPAPRKHAALGYDTVRHYVVLFGGEGEKGKVYSDTWIFDILAGRWYPVQRETHPPATAEATFGLSDGKFYIAGGCNNTDCSDDIWITFEWKKIEIQDVVKPKKRRGAIGGIFPCSWNFIFGLGTLDGTFLEDIHYYGVNTNSWFRVNNRHWVYSATVPHPRKHTSAVMISPSKILLYGGCIKHGACPSSDSWLFDLQTQSWQSLPNCAVPRYSATAVNLQTQENPQLKQTAALIYGGKLESSQHLFVSWMVESQNHTGRSRLDEDEVVVFDSEKQTWSIRSVRPALCPSSLFKIAPHLPEQRSGAAMVSGLTDAYLFGGETSTGRLLDDFWMLTGDWRQSPVKEPCKVVTFNAFALHGLFMCIGFTLILPIGALFALYNSGKSWYNSHQDHTGHRSDSSNRIHASIQIVGVCFIIAGALSAMAAQSDRKHFNSVHAILGLIILILLVLQCLFGLCVFIKKVTSIQFRRAHLWIAFAILVMAFLNTFLGLQLLGAPSTVTIALGGLLIGFLIVLAILLLYSARSPAQAASQPPRSD
ncbi:RING finger protein B [Trichinella spiralis]|uniref:RING finger protein B n=1 Tax=Trichinella spiralis TaxID=6334 RepID=A0A0V1C0U6_TRISP|nr:RING finger protein B [Trichinella spiralis]